jgi:FlaA1/EpsC-like NDP-sugar epimerase
MVNSESGSGAPRRRLESNRLARVSVRVAFDALFALAALVAAVALGRGPVAPFAWRQMEPALGIAAGTLVLGLALAGVYGGRRLEFAALAMRIGLATAAGAAALVLLSLVFQSVAPAAAQSLTAAGFTFPLFLLSRAGWRTRRSRKGRAGSPTIVVGSRDAAKAVIKLVSQRDDLPFDIVGCVDDDGVRSVEGIPLLGTLEDLPAIVDRRGIEVVIVAATVTQPRLVKQVMSSCAPGPHGRAPIVKVLPQLDQLLTGQASYSPVRDVRLDDLLLREPVKVDFTLIAPHLENRVVLVTGAGGSIGSELCRQISRFKPKLLVLLGHGENSLFAIERELRADLGFDRTEIVLADVADGFRVRHVFSQYRPHIVFHAAAHKHVPILETNVCEAVRNNVFGTHAVALAAAAAGVAKFVMISTDKAVNPISVMGATKRLAELICQSFERRTGTEFVSVRFGNVLGSRGSVIDVFKKQIEAGGPLTVTHPEMVRYFMTIQEAVALVLEATAIGRDGQVFVLDMGRPVSVVELAENLVRLCGLRPHEDVEIVFTGIRPGEKLREEILTSHELDNPTYHSDGSPTAHERLFVAQQERIEYERLVDILAELEVAVRTPDEPAVVQTLCRLVPTFQPGAHLQSEIAQSLQAPRNGEAANAAVEAAAEEESAQTAAFENVVLLEDALAARSAAVDASSEAGVATP